VACLGWRATELTSEVGYPAYFGPDDPAVERLEEFLAEFQSGLQVLVVFSCDGSSLCERVYDEGALRFVGRLQASIDRIAHVSRTRSVLDAPIVVAPLTARSVATRGSESQWTFSEDWRELAKRSPQEPLLRGILVSDDARAGGILVELRSLESGPLRAAVHEILDLAGTHERELGSEIFVAGDPVWSVLADDDLDADSRNLTLLMFVVILGVLWFCFRDPWWTVFPVVCVAALTVAVHGVIAAAGLPMTTILAALPPLLVVISVTSSIHLLTALTQDLREPRAAALQGAADRVGTACLWAAITTAVGFASFLWSDLASFRHFGMAAIAGLGMAFACTFALLPALIAVGPRAGSGARLAKEPVRQIEAALELVRARPRLIAVSGTALLCLMIAGAPRLYYSVDFGDQSFVLRSVRFIEANLGSPMTTELSVTLPPGDRIYEARALEVLAELEEWFEREPTTDRVWSFLDFLGEASRVERGDPPGDRPRTHRPEEYLQKTAASKMPLVVSYADVSSYWSEERIDAGGVVEWRDRARVSARRSWLDPSEQVPYVQRLRAFVAGVNARVGPEGIVVALEGGLELAALAEERIRTTQIRSFTSAFVWVSMILLWILRRRPGLAMAAVLANVLPVAALLGVMGWAGIGVDPANTMVAAVLLGIVVDDTLHVALGIESRGGPAEPGAVPEAIRSVGPALFISSACLALGFAVLMFSRWGGLVSFGLLASAGIGLALAADLLLLPAVLLLATTARRRP